MREYGFTDCERGVVDACKSEAMSEPVFIVVAFLLAILFTFIIIKISSPKKTESCITLKREVKKFYGLCGMRYEYKDLIGSDEVFLDIYISKGWRIHGK